ncbi:hypothetical protein SAZ11_07090 [Streptomyces sp. FXJ1.4098]|nr:hypothetical protein [Streptomyces sp. FXJ1.4098]
MSTEITSAADARVISVDDAMTVFEYFTEADSSEVSLVTAYLDGTHSNRVNRRSTKIYLVISGTLHIISNSVEQKVGPLSGVRVPAGTAVKLVGEKAKVAIICGPAFNPADESFEE